MINKKDIGKRAIVLVRDTQTKKMLWRNFGFIINDFLENGNVKLYVPETGRYIYFEAREVKAIDH